MYPPKLDYPVYTLDKKIILDSGEHLTTETLEGLIATNKETSYQKLPFLNYGTLYQDTLRLIQKPPYDVIFDTPKRSSAIKIIEKIHFIPPVLESLTYFKNYDYYTYRHIPIVFALSTIMSIDLMENSEDWVIGAMSGTVHDIGKICVPFQVLKKKGPLKRAERHILEHHTLAGFVLLSYFYKDHHSFSAQVCKEHHERRDASGYPLGIPLQKRLVEIIAVCDIYDALISIRPYRSVSYDNRTALEEITDMVDQGKFSLEVIQTLVSYNRKDKPFFNKCNVSNEKRGIPPEGNSYGIIQGVE